MILKKRVNRIRVFTMAGTWVNAIKTDPEQNLVKYAISTPLTNTDSSIYKLISDQ